MQKDCVMSPADPTFAYITYLFFYLLAYEGARKKSKTMLFSAKKAANQGLFYPFTVPMSNNALSEKLKIFYPLESPKTCNSGGMMKFRISALLTNFPELALLS